MTRETEYYKAINWNAIEDVVDKATWEKLTEQFWLDTRIPLSNDLDDWRRLSEKERDLVGKVFGGLTLLDTLQSVDGVSAIKPDVRTQHEEAVLNNIEFMECYTKDHKLLTIDRGWVPIDQIKEGDTVLAYDKETETTRFERVSQTSSHFAENIYHIHARNFDLKVSGGHRMLFEKVGYSPYTKNSWDKHSSHVLEAREFVDLPRNPLRRLVLARPFESEKKLPLSLQEQFYILLRERSTSDLKEQIRLNHYIESNGNIRTDTYTVLFTFQSEDKIQKLYDLCDSLGYSVKLNLLNTGSKTYKRFLVSIPLEEFVKNRYDALNYQDFFSLADFDRNKATFFIQELTSWCTYRKKSVDNHLLKVLYFTRSCDDWGFVQAIATLAGHAFTKTSTDYKSNSANAKLYAVRICVNEKQNYLQLTSVKTDILEGEQVYGIEVPSSFLVVLAGDKPVISGNCVHAKSYSSIFSTLNTKSEIEEIFEWTAKNLYLQKKAEIIKGIYDTGTPLQKKVASVFLESFLFYSGFFTPLWYLGNNKLPNVAEIIKLIIRDECLTSEHFLLTPKGWKSVKDVRIGDSVVQFNKDTKQMSFAKVQHTSINKPDRTYLLKTEQNHLSLHCSPNHRILGYYNGNSVIQTAKEFKRGNKNIPNTGDFIGSNCSSLTLEERFLIALHADGSYNKTLNKSGKLTRNGQKTGTIPVRFSFSKQRKIEEFEGLLEKLNYSFTKTQDEVEVKSRKTRYHYVVRVPVALVDKDRVKRLPIRDFNKVNKQWCIDYIDEIAKWDGHIVKGSSNRVTYGTVDKTAAELVQTIATLAGYRTHYAVIEDTRKDSFNDIHRIQINKHRWSTNTQNLVIEESSPQCVYGVQVPSGFLLTKHNNAVSITGNSVHGTYIGYKFQLAFNELSEEEQEELKAWTYDLLYELYENEEKYTEELYDEIGWTEEVKTFLRYNANKALMNLGLDLLFPENAEDVNPIIMNGISTGTSNHDFFSQVGNGYLLGQVEAMEDSDYTVGL